VNVYISCALTHVPRVVFQQYVAFIHKVADALRSAGVRQVTYALINSDPQLAEKPFNERARLCYVWDRELVEQADVIIAEATFPSIGMGIELQVAESLGKPIILIFQRDDEYKAAPADYRNPDSTEHTLQIGDGYVSLMALGLPNIFHAIGYTDHDQAMQDIVTIVELLRKPHP
jgi:nucleoside 2-deoxyribosyltransferase